MLSERQIEDLFREISQVSQSSPQRTLLLNSVSLACRENYIATGELRWLRKALEALEESVTLAVNTSQLPKYLSNLASLYNLARVHGESLASSSRVYECVRRAVKTSTYYPTQLYNTTIQWVSMAFIQGEWEQCVEAYSPLRTALHKLLIVQTFSETKESILRNTSVVFAMVAYAASILYKEKGEKNPVYLSTLVDTLESGRTVSLSELFTNQQWKIDEYVDKNRGDYQSLLNGIEELIQLQKKLPTSETLIALNERYDQINELLESDRLGFSLYASWSPIAPDTAQKLVAEAYGIDKFVYIASTSRGSVLVAVSDKGIEVEHSEDRVKADFIHPKEDNLLEESYRKYLLKQGRGEWPYNLKEELGGLFNLVSKRWRKSGIKRIVLSPGGLLNGLPLHTVEVGTGVGKDLLAQIFQISYAPSLRVFTSLEMQREKRTNGNYLGVGNPHPTNADDLPGAELEVKAVQEILKLPGKCLVREEATPQAVLKESIDAFIIHFACHAVFTEGSEVDTFLLLSNNSRITLQDFLKREIRLDKARLVVLSACHTAKTNKRVLLDEYFGLPFGVMLGGVPAVIGTLWPVDDTCAFVFLVWFFESFRKNDKSIAEAFSTAQARVRTATNQDVESVVGKYAKRLGLNKLNSLSNNTERPFMTIDDWGAFVLIGG